MSEKDKRNEIEMAINHLLLAQTHIEEKDEPAMRDEIEDAIRILMEIVGLTKIENIKVVIG